MLLSHFLGKKTKALLKIPLGSLSLGSLFSRIFHRPHHHHHREEDEEDEEEDEDKEREHSPSERKAEDVFEDDLVAKQPDPRRATNREREREGKGKILADGSLIFLTVFFWSLRRRRRSKSRTVGVGVGVAQKT